MIPIFGVGKTPAIVALFIYVLLPILNNTVLGVKNIDKNVIQAGQSMGMTKMQLMKDVELPLALPLIISGIRLSSVYVISWATLASYVGAGGLGDLVFNGLNLYQPPMIIMPYVWLFIVRPSGLQLLLLFAYRLLTGRQKRVYSRRAMAGCAIFLVTSYASVMAWVHTSVTLMPMVLLLPMLLTMMAAVGGSAGSALMQPADDLSAEKRMVKAADKLSALIKCEEELKQGNTEFQSARASTEKALREMHIQAVDCFLEEFLPPCRMTLDEQQKP